MIKIIEIMAFVVSAAALLYGFINIIRTRMPLHFHLYVCAVGCYVLEELWVIINSLFGNAGEYGLVTIRLFAFFGCLCFMLSGVLNEVDKATENTVNKKAKFLAFIAPIVLLLVLSNYIFSPKSFESVFDIVISLIYLSLALFASYFCFKHLFLPSDETGRIKAIKAIDIASLVFYLANYQYPLLYAKFSSKFISFYDIFLSCVLFVIIILCKKEAKKWNTLI